jgi:hypothetical protein
MIHYRSSTGVFVVLLVGLLPAAADSVPVTTQGASTAVQEPATSAASKGSEASASQSGAHKLGIDISKAGTTAESHKAFLRTQSPDRQAQIRKTCEELMTTGSVANADQPGGNSASTEGAAPKTGGITTPQLAEGDVLSFCNSIK